MAHGHRPHPPGHPEHPVLHPQYLNTIEEIHRQRVGHNFAYSRIGPHHGLYALAIAEASVSEFFPVTKLEFDSLEEVLRTAGEFNHTRLHLSRVEAATIIATALGIIRFRFRPMLFDSDLDFEERRDSWMLGPAVGVWLEERP